ncbi:hypothetical protein, partial [Streptodolium elevatio]
RVPTPTRHTASGTGGPAARTPPPRPGPPAQPGRRAAACRAGRRVMSIVIDHFTTASLLAGRVS